MQACWVADESWQVWREASLVAQGMVQCPRDLGKGAPLYSQRGFNVTVKHHSSHLCVSKAQLKSKDELPLTKDAI